MRLAKDIRGVDVDVKILENSTQPVYIPKRSIGNIAATTVLKRLYGTDPEFFRVGGSISVLGMIFNKPGIATSVLSFALPDEKAYAPDEFARIKQLRRSEVAYVRLFAEVIRTHNAHRDNGDTGKEDL